MVNFTVGLAFFRHHFGYRAVLNWDKYRVIRLVKMFRQEKIVFSVRQS